MDHDTERHLFAAANRVALDPEMLGFDPEEADPDIRGRDVRRATLLAGLLWNASDILVDKLVVDVCSLHQAVAPEEWPVLVRESAVLGGLPPRFAPKLTPGVATRFLVVAVDLTARLSQGWRPPSCVAQELMLRCLLDEVAMLVEDYDVDLDEYWRPMLEDNLFEDVDHELLYDRELDGFEDDPTFPAPPGMAPMAFDRWFVPFNPGRRLPPYAEDEPPGAELPTG